MYFKYEKQNNIAKLFEEVINQYVAKEMGKMMWQLESNVIILHSIVSMVFAILFVSFKFSQRLKYLVFLESLSKFSDVLWKIEMGKPHNEEWIIQEFVRRVSAFDLNLVIMVKVCLHELQLKLK